MVLHDKVIKKTRPSAIELASDLEHKNLQSGKANKECEEKILKNNNNKTSYLYVELTSKNGNEEKLLKSEDVTPRNHVSTKTYNSSILKTTQKHTEPETTLVSGNDVLNESLPNVLIRR